MNAAKRWSMKVAYSSPDKQPHTRAIAHTEGEWVKWEDYQKEIAELKAQIEELKNQPDALTAYLYAAELGKDNVKRLKAEVEQLKHKLGRLLGAQQEWVLMEPEEHARLKAEVERLNEAIVRGAIIPDAKPYDKAKGQR